MTHIHFFTLFSIGILCPAFSAWAQEKDEFTLVKKEGSVCLYERWMTYPSSNPPVKSREVKGVFYFNNTVNEGLRLVRDDKRAQLWQSSIAEFKVYPSRDTSTWHEYSYHDIPWPMSDQDHFMEYKVAPYHGGKVLTISFESRVNKALAPEREGVNRIHLSGSWTMEQISPTKVKVTYKVLSKPVGIPRLFADPFIRGNFVTSFQDFIAVLEKTALAEKTK
ncbi:MAG TPA: hypothetical protein VF141_16350 [Chryseolinea sp.]